MLPLPAGLKPAGLVIAGTSRTLALEGDYRALFDLVAGRVSAALAGVRALEEERRRADALAELDRAKTDFFSNVSHEFRTPLTLMLSPLEDMLGAPGLPRGEREPLRMVHRNGLRLLKLVNSLLDFSRIEAGRADASYQPVDLGTATAHLVSVFRSAVERAHLTLDVDCPPLTEPVWVDREMWEKIVLNLLSNALKFTLAGGIAVRMRDGAEAVTLEVSHEVDVASDGDEGLALGVAHRPHVAVVDVGLPGKDGYAVARGLRATLGDAVTLIALTGYGQADDRRRTREAGFDAHLTKPATVEDVLRILAER